MNEDHHRLAGARVLVTGASGLIGAAVARGALAAGATVTGLDSVPAVLDDGASTLVVDVTDRAELGRVMAKVRPHLVLHLAGIPGLGYADATETYRVNTVGTFAVLDAAVEASARKVVYASSINAAGWPLHPGGVRAPEYPFDETMTARVGDWYSLSKVANEAAAAMFAERSGLEVAGLRYPLVRDIVGDPARFGTHLRELMEQDPERAANEGWSYLDLADAAEATLLAAVRDTAAAPGILVAADRTYLSTPTAEALARSGRGTSRPIGGHDVPLDLTRARTQLGFRARCDLHELAPELLVEVPRADP